MRITNEVLLVKIENINTQIKDWREQHSKDIEEQKGCIKDHEQRLHLLENWKIAFVAKFSVYASIAMFLGSLLGTLLVKYVDKLFNL